MPYVVKEIYFTLQGEGANTGRPAVFCRFAGCNLWSGRESDRGAAICSFCDTEFVGTDGPGGGMFESPDELAAAVAGRWPRRDDCPRHAFVVCTGGEPLLQLDAELVRAFHADDCEVAIETNGTVPLAFDVDWVCVSPKAGTKLAIQTGDELKLVFPQPGAEPERYAHLDFDRFFLQPMDGPHRDRNTRLAAEYCRKHTRWRLSLQTHKLIGLP